MASNNKQTKSDKQYKNKAGYSSPFLTLKKNESLTEGIKRLTARGWIIESAKQEGDEFKPE